MAQETRRHAAWSTAMALAQAFRFHQVGDFCIADAAMGMPTDRRAQMVSYLAVAAGTAGGLLLELVGFRGFVPVDGPWTAIKTYAAPIVLLPMFGHLYHRCRGATKYRLGLVECAWLAGLLCWTPAFLLTLIVAWVNPQSMVGTGPSWLGIGGETARKTMYGVSFAAFAIGLRQVLSESHSTIVTWRTKVAVLAFAAFMAGCFVIPTQERPLALTALILPALAMQAVTLVGGPTAVGFCGFISATAAMAAYERGFGPVALLTPLHREVGAFALVLYLAVLNTASLLFAGAVRDTALGMSRLAASEARLRAILDNTPNIAIRGFDSMGRAIFWNRAAERMFGWTEAEVLGRTASELKKDGLLGDSMSTQQLRQKAQDKESGAVEYEVVGKDGKAIAVLSNVFAVPGEKGRKEFVRIDVDISDRARAAKEHKRLEAQLRHSQKLESLGILAGGVAHDFNNLLTGILGHADLALVEMAPAATGRQHLERIITGARRAADLAQQMLAYSGKGKFVVQPLRISDVVKEMSHLLQVSISKRAVLKFEFAPDLPAIEADAAQLRQVVMNLIINASESIGETSGYISISTGTVDCDSAYLADTFLDENLPPGIYVYLEVADSGEGMTPEVKAKIFDPFYTTKLAGRGLGLAAVLGIVRSHKGAIKVYSEPGRGTSFKVLFPASQLTPIETAPVAVKSSGWKADGMALIIDDEDSVRSVGKAMLQKMGFTVLTASDGLEGVETFRGRAAEIRVVLLDMSMPRMGGEETFRHLRRLRPDVRVVLSSGYNEQAATNRFCGKGLAGFIQKPYRYEELVAVVQRATEQTVSILH